ncbi:hypothetical protein GJ496_001600 [Pomphorhynchus laevis]|nr:hypothetical protein GJ496_001600 [Pomphorhynchus laevis]
MSGSSTSTSEIPVFQNRYDYKNSLDNYISSVQKNTFNDSKLKRKDFSANKKVDFREDDVIKDVSEEISNEIAARKRRSQIRTAVFCIIAMIIAGVCIGLSIYMVYFRKKTNSSATDDFFDDT